MTRTSWLGALGAIVIALAIVLLVKHRVSIQECNSESVERRLKGCSNLISLGIGTKRDLAIAYNHRGSASGDSGNLNRAIEDYKSAIVLDPKFQSPHFNAGLAYLGDAKFDLAIDYLTKAILLDPLDAKAYGMRGTAFGSKKNHDAAIADFTKSIELDPNDPRTYFNRGLTYAHKRSFGNAMQDYNKSVALDPNIPDVYLSRGLIKEINGDSAGAVLDYRKVLDLKANLELTGDAKEYLRRLGEN